MSRTICAWLVVLIGDLTWELTTTLDRERGTVIHSEERSSVHVNGDEEAEHEVRDEGYDLLAAGATVRGLPTGGSASFELDAAEFRMQPFNVIHGGNVATLIDSATFWACYLALGSKHPTLHLTARQSPGRR